jgi:hypothetical protein
MMENFKKKKDQYVLSKTNKSKIIYLINNFI